MQAQFCNGLAKLLGLVPSQVKITSSVGCSGNRRRQGGGGGGDVSFQFVSPCGIKAQQIFQDALEGTANPILAYLEVTGVQEVCSVTWPGWHVL